MPSLFEIKQTIDSGIEVLNNTEPLTPCMEMVKLNLEAASAGLRLQIGLDNPDLVGQDSNEPLPTFDVQQN